MPAGAPDTGAFDEDDLVPISALQHLAFCERQWGLIHLENLWAENRLTAQGSLLHTRAHAEGEELRGETLTVRSLRLRSLAVGITGVADVVEFYRQDTPSPEAAPLPRRRGFWRPFPVEYKRGAPKRTWDCDLVQLCAQALCLEEMLGVSIPEGALFYGQTRRRFAVSFDSNLRERTIALARRAHELNAAGLTPRAAPGPQCPNCSLVSLCHAEAISRPADAVARYLLELFTPEPPQCPNS